MQNFIFLENILLDFSPKEKIFICYTLYMSNRADSRKHGMHRIERIRKKSGHRGTTQRENAHAKQQARQDAISTAKIEFAMSA